MTQRDSEQPNTLRLLMVEDSAGDAELVIRQLRLGGYDVRSRRVQDRPSLIAALATAEWDVIVSDYRLPGFDAPAALETLQQSGRDIPFLVVSGTIGEEVAVSMMRAGAHDYLTKANLTRLCAAVERELRDARIRRERRQAVETLGNREAQLALAVESVEMGVFDHCPVTGKTYYSDLCRRHLNLPFPIEPTLEEFLDSVHPEDRGRVAQAVERAFRPESDGRYAEQYRLKPGEGDEPRWISAWGRVLRDEQGKPVRFLGVLRDISEQKRTELELQFQLQVTACITEQSTNCVVLTASDGGVRFMNPETERVFGFTFEEMRGRHPHDVLHHHHTDGRPYPIADCLLAQHMEAGEILRDAEDVMFHKDGTPIPVSVSCGPLELNGTRIGAVSSFCDIRERKRSEQALRKSDDRFRKLFEADLIGILITDGASITEANDHLLSILGYSREEFFAVKRPWRDLTVPESIPECERMLSALSQGNACEPFEKEYFRRDGKRVPVLIAAVELSKAPETEVLCFVLDQTDRKNLEQQFRQAQKLESVGRLAGGVAHDFNNLLTIIIGYSDLVSSGFDREHPSRDALEQISGAAAKAAGLTRQLLTFSRRNPFVPTTFAMDDLVGGIEKMLRRLLGETVEVVLWLRADSGCIHADPGLVEQVVFNLAVNARDAMPEGGKLFIETSRVIVNDGFVAQCFSVAAGNYVSLCVTDTGTGMTPEVQARLFEPFFTTKEPGKGTGLGLSTVYGIVKQCGGSVSVHSTPGLGTAVRVLFPAVEEAAARDQGSPSELKLDGTETVLVVEDEAGVRNYVRDLLEAHGYRALDAARGEDAMEIARYYGGAIHLLLTDVVLAGMSGSEVIRQFHKLRPGIPVLRMSGYTERFGAQLNDGIPLVQKPFTREALLSRIRKILDVLPARKDSEYSQPA